MGLLTHKVERSEIASSDISTLGELSSPTLITATEEAQHLKKLIEEYTASFIKVGDKMDPDRSWMYNRNNPGRADMIPEFAEGVTRFINHAKTLDDFLTSRLIRCPCVNCENVRYHTTETVAMHLMMNGFKPGYTVWTSHPQASMVGIERQYLQWRVR